MNSHKTVTPAAVIKHLNPILRGWALYYHHVASKQTFQTVENRVWRMLWRWAKHRHPHKGRRWVFRRYFQQGAQGSTLYAEVKNRRGLPTRLHLIQGATIPITRHVKVKGTASPDDPRLQRYWAQRRIKEGRTRVAKGSKLYRVAEAQRWQCPQCGTALFNGESLDVHHVTPIIQGGTESEDNLQWLHEACHYQRHRRQSVAARPVA